MDVREAVRMWTIHLGVVELHQLYNGRSVEKKVPGGLVIVNVTDAHMEEAALHMTWLADADG